MLIWRLSEAERRMIVHIFRQLFKALVGFAVAADVISADKAGIPDITVYIDADVGIVFVFVFVWLNEVNIY